MVREPPDLPQTVSREAMHPGGKLSDLHHGMSLDGQLHMAPVTAIAPQPVRRLWTCST